MGVLHGTLQLQWPPVGDPGLPLGRLVALGRRCMAREPAGRPPFGEVARELEAIEAELMAMGKEQREDMILGAAAAMAEAGPLGGMPVRLGQVACPVAASAAGRKAGAVGVLDTVERGQGGPGRAWGASGVAGEGQETG